MNIITSSATALLLAATFTSQLAAAADDAVQIDRDGVQLRDLLRSHRQDLDSTDTAIIASNSSDRPARVLCTAVNANGRRLGLAAMAVPAHGLRFLRASDLANGVDYVGRVSCHSGNAGINGAALLVGTLGITDLQVVSRHNNGNSHFTAPVTASF